MVQKKPDHWPETLAEDPLKTLGEGIYLSQHHSIWFSRREAMLEATAFVLCVLKVF